jgi:cytochrome c biogenesis protein CcmG, thiol:disulfide interchange protein DsbE
VFQSFAQKSMHMTARLFLLLAPLAFGNLQAQSLEQPSVPYPFGIALTAPADSSQHSTNALFSAEKPTVLAFWLTTCMPCMVELGAYAQNFAAWQQQADFRLLAVSIDFPERFQKVRQVAAEKKWPFPVYWDRERAFKNILPGGLNGLPQVFVFDKKGKLVWQHRKYAAGDEAALFEAVKSANQ